MDHFPNFPFRYSSGFGRFAVMVSVAIIGASGYSGEELCRILAGHPEVKIAAVTSRQHAGKPVTEILPRLARHPAVADLLFSESTATAALDSGAEFFFLALPHGLAAEFARPLVEAGKRVVDLSADFRLRDAAVYREFYGQDHEAPELLAEAVFGLPEIHREEVVSARLVASAGCYPTGILLLLVPLLRAGLLDAESIAVSSVSGVSGAGRKAETAYIYSECNESLRAYGLPKHRHLSEIEQELGLAAGKPVTITFVPHLAPMTRGIHTTVLARPAGDPAALAECLESSYAREPFVRFSQALPDTKHVTGTNFCDLAVRTDPRTGRVILLSALDNLVKGASGQAVQNFNLMAGLSETSGLL